MKFKFFTNTLFKNKILQKIKDLIDNKIQVEEIQNDYR